jgi:hypothetical protein
MDFLTHFVNTVANLEREPWDERLGELFLHLGHVFFDSSNRLLAWYFVLDSNVLVQFQHLLCIILQLTSSMEQHSLHATPEIENQTSEHNEIKCMVTWFMNNYNVTQEPYMH